MFPSWLSVFGTDDDLARAWGSYNSLAFCPVKTEAWFRNRQAEVRIFYAVIAQKHLAMHMSFPRSCVIIQGVD